MISQPKDYSWYNVPTTRKDILQGYNTVNSYGTVTSTTAGTSGSWTSYATPSVTAATNSWLTTVDNTTSAATSIPLTDNFISYPPSKVEPEELTKDELVVELRERIEELEGERDHLQKRLKLAKSYLRGALHSLEEAITNCFKPTVLRMLVESMARKCRKIDNYLLAEEDGEMEEDFI